MTKHNQIQDDLECKLHDDIARSVVNYVDLCGVAGISDREIYAGVLAVFFRCGIRLCMEGEMSKSSCLEFLDKQWDYIKKYKIGES